MRTILVAIVLCLFYYNGLSQHFAKEPSTSSFINTYPVGESAESSAKWLPITAAELKASLAPSTLYPYYITDPGQEGMFYYDILGSADTTNGGDFAGTTIRTANGKVFRRSDQRILQLSWFGGVPNDSAKAAQNVAAMNRSVKIARSEQMVLAGGGGTWYFNQTMTFASSYTKRINVKIEGNVTFVTPTDGFVLEHFFPQRFEITGILTGANAGGNKTEESWTRYTGVGIYMKNLYNSYVSVGEVQGWRVGLEMSGEANGGIGTTALGSQYNEVHCKWIHHNYIQVKLSTKGAAGTHGNWCNESKWHIGQLGRGIPGVTYGVGGWIGLQIGSDPGSSQDVWYGISGHTFYDLSIEGLEKGIVAWNSGHISFINFSAEPEGSREHIWLAENSALGGPATHYNFNGGTLIEDRYFVQGGRGQNTRVHNLSVYGQLPNGSVGYVGEKTTVIPSTPTMLGKGAPVPGTLLISSDTYIGFTGLNALKDTTHNYISKLAQYPTVQNGLYKFGQVQRTGAYKRTYLNISTQNSSDTINAPPNLGYVRFLPGENKVVRIHAGDLAPSPDFEEFEVEYSTAAHTLTFTNGLTGAVAIASSNFPSVGIYKCVYRSGQWVVSRRDGGDGVEAPKAATPPFGKTGGTNITTGTPTNSPPHHPGKVGHSLQTDGTNSSGQKNQLDRTELLTLYHTTSSKAYYDLKHWDVEQGTSGVIEIVALGIAPNGETVVHRLLEWYERPASGLGIVVAAPLNDTYSANANISTTPRPEVRVHATNTTIVIQVRSNEKDNLNWKIDIEHRQHSSGARSGS